MPTIPRLLALIPLLVLSATALAQPDPPRPSTSGNAIIRAPAGPSEIVITTTDRLAGAIHSLTWNGREFIDSYDHGRQLQSAASFDCSTPDEFWAERFNPTEAGSRADGDGPTSTSRLLQLLSDGPSLRTTTRMAFWLAPGENSYGRPALNDSRLSRHLLTKSVRIGQPHLPHVIDYQVDFTVPDSERHTLAQFEALTGYMPPAFSRFHTLNLDSGKLEPLDDGPGEQPLPVLFSTPDAAHAIGVFAPVPAETRLGRPSYGRFRFEAERVVKWNCVFREHNPDGIPRGKRHFQLFLAVGTLDDVQRSLTSLIKQHTSPR